MSVEITSPELKKVSQFHDSEIGGLGLDDLADLSPNERAEHILDSGVKEVSIYEFLTIFPDTDDNEKEKIADTLEERGVRIGESTQESAERSTKEENLFASGPPYLKGIPEPDDNTDQPIEVGDNLGLYLKEARKVPLLIAEEEVDLAKRIKRGEKASELLAEESMGGLAPPKDKAELKATVQDGMAAHDHLILANSGLVINMAKRYMNRGVPFLDLIQEGNIGLMRAAKKFEYERGLKFSTYVTWWIRQSVGRAVADYSRTIRLPVHAHEMTIRINRTSQRLEQELNRLPTTKEIAEALDIPVENVENLLKAGRQPLSLETPQDDDDDSPLEDFVGDENSPTLLGTADDNLLQEQLRSVLDTLPPREVRVLQLRYGLHDGKSYTLERIGHMMGVTRERVRQIEAQALSRLRAPSRRRKLIDYYLEE